MDDGSSSRCIHTQHQATFRCHISETPYIHGAAPKHQRVISVGYLVRSEWYSQPSVTTPLCVSGTSKREAIRRLKLQCFLCGSFVIHLFGTCSQF
jgi:hypothetical protein